MARDENAVMYAVEQVCGLYGVQYTREQSRQFNVQGAGGRWRPMFFGSWTDDRGKKHNKGKPDFLLRPRVKFLAHVSAETKAFVLNDRSLPKLSVPVWVECKSAKGRQTPDQAAFQTWVQKNGDYYLLLREDVRPLIAWLDDHGVEKEPDDGKLAAVLEPFDANVLNELPCRHCGFLKAQHMKPAFACPLHLASCNTKLIGKVWSPDLRRKTRAPQLGAGVEQ